MKFSFIAGFREIDEMEEVLERRKVEDFSKKIRDFITSSKVAVTDKELDEFAKDYWELDNMDDAYFKIAIDDEEKPIAMMFDFTDRLYKVIF